MIAYVTKYALTKGILEVNAEATNSEMLVVPRSHNSRDYYHGQDWYWSLDEALRRCEEMRTAKLANLKKQIEKLEKKEFW